MRTERSDRQDNLQTDALGQVILTQKTSQVAAVMFALVGIGLIATGAAVSNQLADLSFLGVFGGMGLGLAALGGGYLWRNWGRTTLLHEYGIRATLRSAEHTLLFQDAEEVAYAATRIYMHGVYGGSVEEMTLRSGDPTGVPFVFKRTYQEKNRTASSEASAMSQLSQRIASEIAERMNVKTTRGQAVPWTPEMQIHDWGIELTGKRTAGSRLPWNQIARVVVEDGIFQLFAVGEPKAKVKLSTGAMNFLPGYILVAARLRQVADSDKRTSGDGTYAPDPVPTGGTSLVVRYVFAIEDSVALQKHYLRSTPVGRKEWRERVWTLPIIVAILIALFLTTRMLAGVMEWLTYGLFMIATAIGSIVVAFAMGALKLWLERRRLARELTAEDARERAAGKQGTFVEWEVTLGANGYAARVGTGELRRGWGEVSRVGWFKGYTFVYLASNAVDDEKAGLIVPPRAFPDGGAARSAFEKIKEWHQRATGRLCS